MRRWRHDVSDTGPRDSAAGPAHAPGATGFSRRRYSLRSLLAFLVLATALPLICVWIYTLLHAAQTETDRANQGVVGLADITAANTDATLDELRRLLEFLAGREQVRALDPGRCDPLLPDLLHLRKDLVNVATVDLTGQGICSVLKPPDGVLRNVGGALWLNTLKRTDAFVISAPQRGIFTGRWVVLLAYPLRDATGAARGAVQLVVELTAFAPVAQAGVPRGGVVAINNREGIVIARAPNPDAYVGADLHASPVIRMVVEKGMGTGTAIGTEGVERFYAFKPIGNSGWFAVAGLPTDSIYAQSRRNAWQAAGLGAAVLLLGVLVMVAIQRRIARPMQALTATARRVAAGEFDERAAEGDGLAEVAEVAAGINHMLDRIPLMERALRDSEKSYRMLFEASPDAIRVICEDRVVLVNPAAIRLFGYQSEHEMIGTVVFDNIDAQHRAAAMARLRIVTEQRQAVPLAERVVVRADGSHLLAEVIMIPVDFAGKPAALAILRDLTERKAAEQRVRRLSNLYAALSRTNEAIFRESDPHALYDQVCEIAVTLGGLKTAVIRTYDAATRMLAPSEFRGPVQTWVGNRAVSLDDPHSNAARAAREGTLYICNDIANDPATAAMREDAARVGVRAAAGFAFHIDGALAGVFSLCAEEKGFFDSEMIGLLQEMANNLSFALLKQRSAIALARSEARYRALFDASPDAIRVICADRVVMINPAGVRLFDLDSAEGMVGKLVYDTIDPEFRAQAMERIRIVIEERRPVPSSEQVLLRADGSRVDVEVISLPFEYEGKPAVLSIVHNQTARKAVERATLRLNAELEERVQRRTAELKHANADLESFSYSVAHDLRAPLRSMSGFAQLLEMDIKSGNLDDLPAHVGRIVGNAGKMNQLIDGLLNISNASHGKLEIERIDMGRMLNDVLGEQEALKCAHVTVGPMPSIDGDPASIRQVWTNLVSNALKYSAGQAQPEITIDCELGMVDAIFRMRDNGVGFNASYSAKLFGVFSRLHSAQEFEGIGIGLAIVRRIVERHGGRVWAEGSLTTGATFYFALPRNRQQVT